MSDSADFEYVNERNIDSVLTCTICTEPINNPTVTSCGHRFCRGCITSWTQRGNGTCPICRRNITRLVPASPTLRNRLDSLEVKCRRCGQNRLKRRDFDNHIRNVCSMVETSCLASDFMCQWRGPRGQLNNHLAQCNFQRMKPTLNTLRLENAQLKAQNDEMQEENERTAERHRRQLREFFFVNSP